MRICLCQYKRGENDKLIHITNLQDVTVRVRQDFPEGTVLTLSDRTKLFRSVCHHVLSVHGWEVYDENLQLSKG